MNLSFSEVRITKTDLWEFVKVVKKSQMLLINGTCTTGVNDAEDV
jgi:hypothetical protein